MIDLSKLDKNFMKTSREVVSRDEIRRLEKVARDKNKEALKTWIVRFERALRQDIGDEFEEVYRKHLLESIDNLCTATAYTCMFSEVAYIDKEDIPEFMEDMITTVDMFRRGEYIPEDYVKQLKEVRSRC